MATVREELHALIDEMSEDEIEAWFTQLREQREKQKRFNAEEWHESVSKLREELYAKHGMFQSAADLINELREERLNDIMGSP